MNWVEKELDFIYRVKNDAVSLTGVWLNSPVVNAGNAAVAAGIYRELLEEEQLRNLRGEIHETPAQRRHALLETVEKKIMERDNDDLFLLLTA